MTVSKRVEPGRVRKTARARLPPDTGSLANRPPVIGPSKTRGTRGEGRSVSAGPPPDIVTEVVSQLKPELNAKIESLRADLLADFKEMVNKATVPAPQTEKATGVDLNSVLSALKGNPDMGKIAALIPQAQAPANMEGFTPEQRLEMMKAQNNSQMMAMVLPELIKLIAPQQGNAFMNEIMQRMFLEQMMSVQASSRAQASMMAKLAGDPKAMADINAAYERTTKPIDAHINRTPVPMPPQNPQGGAPNA